MQPGTFTPSVGARTRYGIMANPWDARNFYHFMKIETVGTYTWTSARQFIAEPSPINLAASTATMRENDANTIPANTTVWSQQSENHSNMP